MKEEKQWTTLNSHVNLYLKCFEDQKVTVVTLMSLSKETIKVFLL